jgi:hypothetical protein
MITEYHFKRLNTDQRDVQVAGGRTDFAFRARNGLRSLNLNCLDKTRHMEPSAAWATGGLVQLSPVLCFPPACVYGQECTHHGELTPAVLLLFAEACDVVLYFWHSWAQQWNIVLPSRTSELCLLLQRVCVGPHAISAHRYRTERNVYHNCECSLQTSCIS